jgi:hypothetical protein
VGRLLQIRVSATTYRPEDVARAWPRLFAAAWPNEVVRGAAAGVLELVEGLSDSMRFGEMPEQLKRELEPGITRAIFLKRQLEEALGEWNARRANELSEALEQILDETEKAVHP